MSYMKQKLVVISGAGISAESGLKTFRDHDGLWEGYNVEQVATPQAWVADPSLVLDFYNQRRANVRQAKPNNAHLALAQLEDRFSVSILTQNIDDLHERAGSSEVIHLHGEILKAQSSQDPNLCYELEGRDISLGDLCELGSQLRPHVVWFGEAVPKMEVAIEKVRSAELILVIGTSLAVYPAASLVDFSPAEAEIFVVDPQAEQLPLNRKNQITFFADSAAKAVPKLVEQLLG